MKRTHKYSTFGMSIGMCIGLSVGVSIGSAFNNTALGMSIGLSIGMCLGMVLGLLRDNVVNKQLEEKGYRITDIKEDKEDCIVTVESKTGESQAVTVKTKILKSEKFKVGDFVYLSKNGDIDKLFN